MLPERCLSVVLDCRDERPGALRDWTGERKQFRAGKGAAYIRRYAKKRTNIQGE